MKQVRWISLKRLVVLWGIFICGFLPGDFCAAEGVTTNIVLRVFRIAYGDRSGSSFTIEVDDRQYLVTAKHLVEGIGDGDSVKLLLKDGWKPFRIKPIYCSSPDVDIVALALPERVSPTFRLVPTLDKIRLGQDVYFFGFPYGLASYQDGWAPIPFVGKGILSAIDRSQRSRVFFYVDGFSNLGHSGGPVVFVDSNTKTLKVAGVISGWEATYTQILNPPSGSGRAVSEMQPSEMQETGLFVPTNLGIIKAYKIDHIVEAIRNNPFGPFVGERKPAATQGK